MMHELFDHEAYMGIDAIFNAAQLDANSHPRLRKELAEIYAQQNAKNADFIMEFLQCFSTCAVIPDKYPSVERALDFASGYLALHYQDQDEVLVAVFEFIFKNHGCKSQAVRFRCCEFINRVLHSMDDQASLYDDIFEKIASTMLERLQDKVPSIRSQAVMALQRLQIPQDPTCPIIKAFLFHMERDPSHDVRAKVVKHIAITPRTLPAVFDRIYDVSSMVRKESYKTVSRLRVVKLSIKQIQKICSAGVGDSSEVVKSFVLNNLVLTWYKQADCSFTSFLKLLFVNTMDEDVLEKILFHMFKKQASSSLVEMISTDILSKEKLIPINQLTPENVILWLHLIKYFSQNENESERELVSSMIPELTKFAKYLKDFSLTLMKNDLKQEFIVIQLFKIAGTFSFDDEMGREQMRMMCVNYLMDENVGKRAVPAIAKVFELLVPVVKERLVMMAEIISDIREPLQQSPFSSQQSEVTEIQTQLAQLSCDSDRVQKTDAETLVKCLTIIIEFFKAKDVTNIDATLLSLKDNFVVECFTSPNIAVQNLAQDVMAFYCIWNLAIAKENFVKFVFQMSNENTCTSALQSVVDILLVHGFAPFSMQNSPNNNNVRRGSMSLDNLSNDPNLTPTQVFLVTLLTNLLESENVEIRAKASQGLAKLMLVGHLKSPLILARLILIWFSPQSATQPEIRLPLGIFLSDFSTKTQGAGDIIVNSIVPALKAIQEMSVDEDDEINPMSVAKLFVSLIRKDVCLPPDNVEEKGSYHLRLASKVCRELLIVNGCDPVVLAKILLMIELEPEDANCSANLLLTVCRGIKKMGKFWDKKVLKTMQGFKAKLEEMKARDVTCATEERSNVMPSIMEMDESAQDTSKSRDKINDSSESPDISKSYSIKPSSGEIFDSELQDASNEKIPDAGNMIIDETLEDAEVTILEKVTVSPIGRASIQRTSTNLSSDGEIIRAGGIVPESDDDDSDSDEDNVIPVRKSVLPENAKVSCATDGEIPDSTISGVNPLVSSSDEDQEETESNLRRTRSASSLKQNEKRKISKPKSKAEKVISSSDGEEDEVGNANERRLKNGKSRNRKLISSSEKEEEERKREKKISQPKSRKVKSSSVDEEVEEDSLKKRPKNARSRTRKLVSSSEKEEEEEKRGKKISQPKSRKVESSSVDEEVEEEEESPQKRPKNSRSRTRKFVSSSEKEEEEKREKKVSQPKSRKVRSSSDDEEVEEEDDAIKERPKNAKSRTRKLVSSSEKEEEEEKGGKEVSQLNSRNVSRGKSDGSTSLKTPSQVMRTRSARIVSSESSYSPVQTRSTRKKRKT